MKIKDILTFSLAGLLSLPLGGIVLAHEGHNQAFGGKAVSTEELPKITVSPDGQRAIGLKTQLVSTGSLDQLLSATGQVQAAENRSVDITPRVSGTVSKVYVQQGSSVEAGQTLASIYSLEVANVLTQLLQDRARLQADLAKSRTQYQGDIAIEENHVEIAKITYQREQALLKEGITAKKDYLEARHGYEDALVRLNILKRQSAQEAALLQRQLSLTIGAVKSQLQVMGLSGAAVNQALATNRISSEIPVTSPIAGVVTFRDVTVGETLDSGQKLFSVVNLSPIWIVANIFQEQIPKIHMGQSVKIKTPNNQIITGDISSIGTIVDPTQRTVPVRVVSKNTDGRLKPGMFVNTEIVVGQSDTNRVVIPASALVEENGRMVTYLKNGNDFQAIPVQVGQKASDQVEILEGIYEGDEIVTQGAKQLRAQSLISASKEGAEESDDKAAQPENLSTLLMGIAIGAALMLGLGAVWLLLKKRTARGGR